LTPPSAPRFDPGMTPIIDPGTRLNQGRFRAPGEASPEPGLGYPGRFLIVPPIPGPKLAPDRPPDRARNYLMYTPNY